MRNLIDFLIKNTHWLLFLLMGSISFFFLVKNNDFQRSAYVKFETDIAGAVFSVSNTVTSYFGLKKENNDLLERTAEMSNRIDYLESQITQMKDSAFAKEIIEHSTFDSISFYSYHMAKVVNNSLSGINNYITLNKGSKNGIEQDMGVFSVTGVVGFVMNVSDNFAVVLPVLNSNFHLSCKVKGTEYFGSLSWDGKSIKYAHLEELPRYAEFQEGDTIVTSGYSSSFPQGIPVGIVEDANQSKNENFNTLKIKLLTDFGALNEVLVVSNKLTKEQQTLEKAAKSYGH